jgi:hypothetical protein
MVVYCADAPRHKRTIDWRSNGVPLWRRPHRLAAARRLHTRCRSCPTRSHRKFVLISVRVGSAGALTHSPLARANRAAHPQHSRASTHCQSRKYHPTLSLEFRLRNCHFSDATSCRIISSGSAGGLLTRPCFVWPGVRKTFPPGFRPLLLTARTAPSVKARVSAGLWIV